MVYRLVYTRNAQKDLDKMDDRARAKVLKKLDSFLVLPEPMSKAKRLKNVEAEVYRFRIGNYRVIFRKDPKTNRLVILVVLRIAHRKQVYKNL